MLALQIANAVAFVTVVVVNALAGSTTLLNNRSTADVSAAYPTLITPAGFTFSIWGIIYILLFAFVVFQLLPRHRQDPFNEQVSYLFIVSSVFNIVWLFLWQYDYITVSVPVIFALLASLVAVYLRLHVGKSKAPLNEKTKRTFTLQRLRRLDHDRFYRRRLSRFGVSELERIRRQSDCLGHTCHSCSIDNHTRSVGHKKRPRIWSSRHLGTGRDNSKPRRTSGSGHHGRSKRHYNRNSHHSGWFGSQTQASRLIYILHTLLFTTRYPQAV